MVSLPRLLWRLFVACLGFLAAVVGSAAVVVASLLVPIFVDPDVASHMTVHGGDVLGLTLLLDTASRTIWPMWLVAGLVIEVAGVRSLLLPLFGFPALAVVCLYAFAAATLGDCTGRTAADCNGVFTDVPATALRVLVAAGLVGGFLHWLVAGRGAGITMRPERTSAGGDLRPPHA